MLSECHRVGKLLYLDNVRRNWTFVRRQKVPQSSGLSSDALQRRRHPAAKQPRSRHKKSADCECDHSAFDLQVAYIPAKIIGSGQQEQIGIASLTERESTEAKQNLVSFAVRN